MIVTPLVLSTLLGRGEDKENRGQLGRGEACWRGTYQGETLLGRRSLIMKEGQEGRKFIRAFTVDAHIVPFLRPNL